MSRKKIVAGNWKMNTSIVDGINLVTEINNKLKDINGQTVVIVAPPFTHLTSIKNAINNSSIKLAAQNVHHEVKGAFTGEISIDMLKEIGVEYVILGHSERRQYFGENEELLIKKINTVLASGLKVIYCVGEPLEIRENNTQNELIANQLTALNHLTIEQLNNIVIAYEPVWAIGTGKTASSEQAQDMHAFIRLYLKNQFNQEVANSISILYGGSCNAQNANELFAKEDVDGGLIGGAALKAEDFTSIIISRNK